MLTIKQLKEYNNKGYFKGKWISWDYVRELNKGVIKATKEESVDWPICDCGKPTVALYWEEKKDRDFNSEIGFSCPICE